MKKNPKQANTQDARTAVLTARELAGVTAGTGGTIIVENAWSQEENKGG